MESFHLRFFCNLNFRFEYVIFSVKKKKAGKTPRFFLFERYACPIALIKSVNHFCVVSNGLPPLYLKLKKAGKNSPLFSFWTLCLSDVFNQIGEPFLRGVKRLAAICIWNWKKRKKLPAFFFLSAMLVRCL